LANTLTGRILTTTSPGGLDVGGNLDPNPGEADVNDLLFRVTRYERVTSPILNAAGTVILCSVTTAC
jgi:hypothetical protein